MEEKKIWRVIHNSPDYHPLDLDCADHLKQDPNKSFLGWLLTLNEEELDTLDDFANDTENVHMMLPFIYHFKRLPMLDDEVSVDNIDEALQMIITNVQLIRLYRKGLLEYRIEGDGTSDDDWLFKITEKGVTYASNMGINMKP